MTVLLITGGATASAPRRRGVRASRGDSVAINYRTRDAEAKKVVADIRPPRAAKRVAIKADMASEADIVRMFEETDEGARPDHPAGQQRRHRSQCTRVDDYDAARPAEAFATNVTGLMLCCREAAQRMSTKHGGKGGAIVNVSSMAATIGGRRARRPMPRARQRSIPSLWDSRGKSP